MEASIDSCGSFFIDLEVWTSRESEQGTQWWRASCQGWDRWHSCWSIVSPTQHQTSLTLQFQVAFLSFSFPLFFFFFCYWTQKLVFAFLQLSVTSIHPWHEKPVCSIIIIVEFTLKLLKFSGLRTHAHTQPRRERERGRERERERERERSPIVLAICLALSFYCNTHTALARWKSSTSGCRLPINRF